MRTIKSTYFILLTLRESSPDMMLATTSVSALRVPRLRKNIQEVNERVSGYALKYTVPRLCQKYTCSEWLWLYASGYPSKCIAPLFPIGTRNLQSS